MPNRAAELGPSRLPWWLDWRGECAAIVASGPSVKGQDVSVLRDRIHVIAIKQNVDLCPWADVVYGCESPWWESRKGLPEFKGLKVCYDRKAANAYADVKKIEIKNLVTVNWDLCDRLQLDEPGVLGAGGNSGFQALNLALQFGAVGVLLIGFDMHAHGGVHWYGRNTAKGMRNPEESNFKRWRAAFKATVPVLQQLGVDVVNASPVSSIDCYRRASIEDALKGWGL